MTPGEAADMTIKAVDSQGAVITDYNGTIIIDFDGYQDTNVYDMPSNGFYTFTAADQGIKTFSKGFVIKKSGQYVLKVYDSLSDTIVGTLPLNVGAGTAQSGAVERAIQIQEPLSGGTVQAGKGSEPGPSHRSSHSCSSIYAFDKCITASEPSAVTARFAASFSGI